MELFFLQNKQEEDYYQKLKSDILKISKPTGDKTSAGCILYTFIQHSDVLKFYEDKFTYRDIGEIYFYFWDSGKPNNGMQFYTLESMWQYVSIDSFYKNLFEPHTLEYVVHSKTSLESRRISKPKELKGIRQIFSVPFIGDKGRSGVFVNGDDVWVKHGDYFSPSINPQHLSGAPISVRAEYLGVPKPKRKFIYEDNWGDVVLKTQAWIEVKNLYAHITPNTQPSRLSIQVLELLAKHEELKLVELVNTHMGRFWENVICQLQQHKFS